MDNYNELIPGIKIVLKSLEEATHTQGDGTRRYTANGLFINPQMYKYFGREVTVDYIYTDRRRFSILEDRGWEWDTSCIDCIIKEDTFDPASKDELAELLFGGE